MNDIMSSSDIMLKVMNFSANGDSQKIQSVWKDVVSKIKNYQSDDDEAPLGERLAASTRIVDLKNGVLLAETDHPGWIQYLNFYKKFIIKGIKMAIPDMKITSMAFRIAGSKISLSESYEESVRKNKIEMDKRIDAQENAMKKYVGKSAQSGQKDALPPELTAKFDSIIQNMLTNPENK